ncbi:MAG: hypothetical protein JXM74_04625 [Fusobacteriaceae bacterium]|nr:hypothetical protein [Fusobacteriaceae bacterium]MBN2838020.1 hypothetical protein [Fusobacteriaceae bacterium]
MGITLKILITLYILICLLGILTTEAYFSLRSFKKKQYKLKNKIKGSLKLFILGRLILFLINIIPVIQIPHIIGNLVNMKEISEMDVEKFKEKFKLEEA